MRKPIQLFFSPLSRRVYATRAYKVIKPGVVEVTGERFDVTDQIAALAKEHNLDFLNAVERTER